MNVLNLRNDEITNRTTVSLQTDDKGVFSTDLSTEYQIMQKTFNLTDKMIQSLAYLSIDYIFESDSVKDRLRRYFEGWQQLNH